ncbi:MAG: hypothetical protein GOMPHAMPRED_004796 [Gomphillus americanus]|uniref:Translation initiation factor eIF2B subunit gamma n=1 Tax=Gomphillus americanus TaxID=1940652 RepID=A0A8H3EJV5_9LECA|nr:MAG: hypothetical protein GOMPHAMPRED_004796 [Gomphillus americanus]
MPLLGFQALILCGPGASLSTFTTNPEEFPKALIPIANRPMIWYPLDWCYRMGVSDITLITPVSSTKAIEAALSQNPHLTSLPSPKADVLAPEGLDYTNNTAEILRLPEVRSAITGDFIVLPCDLVCELAGESLIEAWMVKQAGLDKISGVHSHRYAHDESSGQLHGRRGGLGVYFDTKGEGTTKHEETDFLITAPVAGSRDPTTEGSLVPNVQELVYSTTKDTLEDIKEENKSFPLRHALADRHPRTKILTTYRDAHIYIFPYWVLNMIKRNPEMESISEDVLGWWIKARWQKGFAAKLGLEKVLRPRRPSKPEDDIQSVESELNLAPISTNSTTDQLDRQDESQSIVSKPTQSILVPPFLAYIQPKAATLPLIRRVDTVQLLLYVSLRLAKLDSIQDIGKAVASPFAHNSKVAYPAGLAAKTTINQADCLIAENTTVESKSIIKESVIGANCTIKSGVKLTRCVLMDGVVVGERCELTGCIIGRRAQIGQFSVLVDCQVQEGNIIPEKTDAKGQNFMVFEGLEVSDEDEDDTRTSMAEDT